MSKISETVVERICLNCNNLKGRLRNGLPQCGLDPGPHPGTKEGNYLRGKVFPVWFGCCQFTSKVMN